jgi:hypothetical protein
MAKTRPTITKRLREKARMEKRMRKAERKAEREMESAERADVPAGIDPDIAHIVPGPQRPAWMDFVPEDELPEEE